MVAHKVARLTVTRFSNKNCDGAKLPGIDAATNTGNPNPVPEEEPSVEDYHDSETGDELGQGMTISDLQAMMKAACEDTAALTSTQVIDETQPRILEVESGENISSSNSGSFHSMTDGKWMSSEDIESMCRDISIRSVSATAEAIWSKRRRAFCRCSASVMNIVMK